MTPTLRRSFLLAAGALTLGAALVGALRFLGLEAGPLMILVASTPYAVLAAVAAVPLSLLGRSRALAAGAMVVALLLGWTQLPLYTPDRPELSSVALTVMTANVQRSSAGAPTVVEQVRAGEVDLLGVQEVTDGVVSGLLAAGLEAELPYSFVRAEPGYGGTALWSRYPIRDARKLDGFLMNQLVARVDRPGAGALTVAVVHPAPPNPSRDRSTPEHQRLRTELQQLSGTVLAFGDFNATYDNRAMRRLQADGFLSATEQAGAGWLRTWGPGSGAVSLYGIDHVLVRGRLDAMAVRSVRVPGADHRAVIATLG